jgi:adenosine deaminase
MTMNIFLCTLGQSWAVVPEAYALLEKPSEHWLYQHHPLRDQLLQLQQHYQLEPADEIWICTTNDAEVMAQYQKIKKWQALNPNIPSIKLFTTAEIGDIHNERAGLRVKELIFRCVLAASEAVGATGKLFLSLAGGRKTMSADLQQAGHWFGTAALLHVLAPPFKNMSDAMKQSDPEFFTRPLPQQDCEGLYPTVVGVGARSPIVYCADAKNQYITSERFPLPTAATDACYEFRPLPNETWLVHELESRQRESEALLSNFYDQVVSTEKYENWRSLYRLAPQYIDYLRDTPLAAEHRALLHQLPKADLHCHIGGCLDLAAQINVARRILNAYPNFVPDSQWQALIEHNLDWPKTWAQQLKKHPQRRPLAAWILTHADFNRLNRELYQTTEPRFALKDKSFSLYEQPGELTGSAQLSEPEALETYVNHIVDDCRKYNVRYLELRGSPQKYFPDDLNAQMAFLRRLEQLSQASCDDVLIRFIVIVDRRDLIRAKDAVTLAVTAKDQLNQFVVGLDVAGDESSDNHSSFEQLAEILEPAHRCCLPITIHAGEGTQAESIWNAAYKLHADRIGHGLTLFERNDLQNKLRDRGVCIEMCPTSNIEVVGYTEQGDYPLKHYWQEGVALSICTDNPGISRTNLVDEYLQAASLCKGGLSLWDTLAIIKRGFVHSFLPANEKEQLLKTVDQQLFTLVNDYLKQRK